MRLLARGLVNVSLLTAFIAAAIAAIGGAWWGSASFAGIAIGTAMVAAWLRAHAAAPAPRSAPADTTEPEDAKPGGAR